MKRIVRILVVAIALLGIALVGGVNYAVEHILPYSPIRPHRCTAEEMARSAPDLLTPASFGAKWDEFDITVEDTIRLKGWYISSMGGQSRGTIVLLHGIASCRIAMLSVARSCVRNGFNCILYDSRANGESGGLNCTFGYYEKRDLSAYLDSAIVRYPGCGPFGVFGNSFGAAMAIQALAWDKRLVCGVAESPFATLREIIHDYFRQMFILPLNSIPDAALKHSERIAHFQVDSVSPESDARNITQPTMIIHGLSDSKISPGYGKRVYDNLASVEKEWYPIPGGGHNSLAQVGGAEYERRIVAFFQKYLVRRIPPA